MSEQKLKFKGRVKKCIYKSDSFSVYSLDVDRFNYPDIKQNSYGNVGICGELYDLAVDVEYDIEAFETDTKYGKSYKVIKIKRDEPTTKEETYTFLREILTDNQAATLIENYPNIIDIVKEDKIHTIDVSRLKGIGEKTIVKIKDKIIENFYLIDLVAEFGNVLSLAMLKKIYDRYNSVELLKKKLKAEPYKTLTRISGIGFKKADAIILELQKQNIIDFGYDVSVSPDRCLACLIYLLEENENNGNTCANLIEIRSECVKMVSACVDHFAEIIKDDAIYYNKEALNIALKKTYECEKYIANSIKYGLSVNNKWDFDWKQYQNSGRFHLSDEQIELLHGVCENNIVILSGGAGMGKSASTEALIRMLEDNNKTFILAAPTGKSSKVLKDFTRKDAKTIHRALSYNPQLGWGYNKENKIDVDVLLIDEFSMVSIDLMTHVIDAINFNNTKLVMVGDPNQLPSIQCGNLLHDFLMSGMIPVVKLTKVFRYGSGGILTVATDIINNNAYLSNNCSKMNVFGDDKGYTFIRSDDNTIIKDAISLYKKLITVGIGDYVYKPEEIVVLTAYNKGDYGAVLLNNELQKIANKNYGSTNCLQYGKTIYYLDDVIMQCANDYGAKVYNAEEDDEEAFVANGECSKITLLNKSFMVGDFDDVRIKYSKENLSNIALAYSYSIHRSQGSTIKIAIVVSPRSHIYMNTSNLLYVAVTRASDKCFHFGLPSTVNIAMKKKENFKRNTFMQDFFKKNN